MVDEIVALYEIDEISSLPRLLFMRTKPKIEPGVWVAVRSHGHVSPAKLQPIKSTLEALGYRVVLELNTKAGSPLAKGVDSFQSAAGAGRDQERSSSQKKASVLDPTLSDPVKAELQRLEHRIVELEATLLAAIRGEKTPDASETRLSEASNAWDPYAEGRKLVQQLKEAEGGGLDRNDAAERLSISVPALHNRRKRGGIVAWADGGADRFKFPRWQFGANGMLAGIEDCLRELQDADEWAIMRFFLFPSEIAGGKRPLDLLREGRVNDAIELARSQSVHV